jgi:hypothetical protein
MYYHYKFSVNRNLELIFIYEPFKTLSCCNWLFYKVE